MDELNGILEDYGVQTVKEGDSIDTVNEKRTQAIELIKQEAIERQRLNDIASGNDTYAKALLTHRTKCFRNFKGLRQAVCLRVLFGLLTMKRYKKRCRHFNHYRSTGRTEHQPDSGQDGRRIRKGVWNKIYANIQDKMRAIGISEKTIAKAWWDDGFFTKTNIVQNYIKRRSVSSRGTRPLHNSREQICRR